MMVMRSLFFALAVMAMTMPSVSHADDVRTVSVMGRGVVTAVPDMAEFSVSVVEEAATAEKAMAQASRRAVAVIDALKGASIAEKDLRTSSINVHPVYEQKPRGDNRVRKIVGYNARLSVTVKVRDITRLGAVLGTVTASGVSGLGGIRFDIADRSPLIDRARQAAVKDAKHAATVLATAAGAKVGIVKSLRDEGTTGGGPRPMMALRSESAGRVPVMTGDITVEVRVQAVYELAAK